MRPVVDLRRACWRDALRLLAWRNDPHTRAMSVSTDKVGVVEHVRWMRRTLADEAADLYVATSTAGEPVGVVRVERQEARSVMSITVAPCHRGRGLATPMIEEACVRSPEPVVAYVYAVNVPSRQAFVRAGFRHVATHRGGLVVELAWRTAV